MTADHRTTGKQLELTFGDQRATVELLPDAAPLTCELIVRNLPLAGRLTHAKNLDNEVLFMLPFLQDANENVSIPEPGGLFIWRYTLCVWFGPTSSEPLSNHFGRVTHNLSGLAAVGRTIWARQGAPARLAVLEETR